MHSPLEAYETIADHYDEYWGPASVAEFLPVVELLLLPHLSPGACILDVCCGTGQLAAELTRAGYSVVGVDHSVRMLSHARANAPAADFVAADVRQMGLNLGCDAGVSTFDVFNHFMSEADVAAALRCAAAAMRPGAWLLFDLFTEEGIRLRDDDVFGMAGDDRVCFVKTAYDPSSKRVTVDIISFEQRDYWRRSDVRLEQRPHELEAIGSALESAGFTDFQVFEGYDDLGFEHHAGRSFVLSRLGEDRHHGDPGSAR